MHMVQNMNRQAGNRQEKHFYGTSPAGSGKTAGILMSIFNVLIKMNPVNITNVQYLILCTTFDMAYATFRFANEMQAYFRARFSIGLLSKESELDQPITEYHIIICTPSEIEAKINDHVDNHVTNVIMDDADGYLQWEKMVLMMEKLSNATFTVVSTNQVPQLARILPLDAANIRHYKWQDDRHYVELIPSPNVSSIWTLKC